MIVTVTAVALILVIAVVAHRRPNVTPPAEIVADPDGRRLLGEMVRLRATLEERKRRGVKIVAAGAIVIVVLTHIVLAVRQQSQDIIAARSAGRAATCTAFEKFTNLLIAANPPKSEEARAASLVKVEAFRLQFEKDMAPLGCHFTFAVPPVSS